MGHFWSVAKVTLRFGCAKQSKNLKRYLILIIYYIRYTYDNSNTWYRFKIFSVIFYTKKLCWMLFNAQWPNGLQISTTVNSLPNRFALVRLGKNLGFCYGPAVSSYQTLVSRPNSFTRLHCLSALLNLVSTFGFSHFWKKK